MIDITSCSNNLECLPLLALAVAPTLLIATFVTGITIYAMQKKSLEGTLIFKILKITFRIEEALILIGLLLVFISIL
ncbi:MAG: hypothetical protein R3346_04905 [Candidatus Spechtbacterales bacterium]|nr:hypothetical protein [Candidatus Spechtbacterales bacterium]